jgi:ferric-dicitrate binding protein FerR (iron transport regulator)
MEYQESRVEALLLDEQFLAWYKRMDASAIADWEKKMEADPALRADTAAAVKVMDQLLLTEKAIDQDHKAQAIAAFRAQLNQAQSGQVVQMSRWRTMRKWVAVAALLVFAAGIWWWQFGSSPAYKEIFTQFGETRQVQLPDGSIAMLNANTKLRYTDGSREVWIKGEAFLEVAKTVDKAKFTVHTDGYDVVVHGTRFNVLDRGDGRQGVMLEEGAVELKARGHEPVQMQPGEWIQLRNGKLDKSMTDGKAQLAWKDHKLFFEKTLLPEVAAIIAEHYGVQVQVEPALDQTAVSGIFPNDNLDILVQTLETAQGFRIERTKNILHLYKK